MTVTDQVRREPAPARASKAYAWHVVAVFVAASTLSFIEYLDTLAPATLPLVGEMKSWQLAFLCERRRWRCTSSS